MTETETIKETIKSDDEIQKDNDKKIDTKLTEEGKVESNAATVAEQNGNVDKVEQMDVDGDENNKIDDKQETKLEDKQPEILLDDKQDVKTESTTTDNSNEKKTSEQNITDTDKMEVDGQRAEAATSLTTQDDKNETNCDKIATVADETNENSNSREKNGVNVDKESLIDVIKKDEDKSDTLLDTGITKSSKIDAILDEQSDKVATQLGTNTDGSDKEPKELNKESNGQATNDKLEKATVKDQKSVGEKDDTKMDDIVKELPTKVSAEELAEKESIKNDKSEEMSVDKKSTEIDADKVEELIQMETTVADTELKVEPKKIVEVAPVQTNEIKDDKTANTDGSPEVPVQNAAKETNGKTDDEKMDTTDEKTTTIANNKNGTTTKEDDADKIQAQIETKSVKLDDEKTLINASCDESKENTTVNSTKNTTERTEISEVIETNSESSKEKVSRVEITIEQIDRQKGQTTQTTTHIVKEISITEKINTKAAGEADEKTSQLTESENSNKKEIPIEDATTLDTVEKSSQNGVVKAASKDEVMVSITLEESAEKSASSPTSPPPPTNGSSKTADDSDKENEVSTNGDVVKDIITPPPTETCAKKCSESAKSLETPTAAADTPIEAEA